MAKRVTSPYGQRLHQRKGQRQQRKRQLLLTKASQAKPGRSSANKGPVDIVDGVASQRKTAVLATSASASKGAKKSPVRIPPKDGARPCQGV